MKLSKANAWRTDLLENKCNQLMALEEVLEASKNRFGYDNLIRLYGMSSCEYYAKGIRIFGRTAIEAKVDSQANFIANRVKETVQNNYPNYEISVIDLFMGSGNLLYQIAESLQSQSKIAFERDENIYNLTRSNLELIDFSVQYHLGNFQDLFPKIQLNNKNLNVIIIDPPWGNKGAFNFSKGLDLRLTEPPLIEILHFLKKQIAKTPVIYVVPVYKIVVEESLLSIAENYSIYERGLTLTPATKIGYVIGKI
ncbi:RsmD family RNA methyltransferase [Candidatus Uabimicrobium sp. HlEnr_7]|uniref:RsmD family RNA methyltransferase n=1 Tax=Candidatus Uabimicrobium helgolandensis TaxID=3095367 RepID=UPI003555E04E